MKTSLFTAVLAMLAFASTCLADDTKTFTVQNGSFPWYDRQGEWALDGVPDSLKSNAPLPQQSCSSRGLEIPASLASVLIGVCDKDLESFKAKFPAAVETADTVSIKNKAGVSLSYRVLKLDSPPAIIDASGSQAGLLILKMDRPAASPAPSAASK